MTYVSNVFKKSNANNDIAQLLTVESNMAELTSTMHAVVSKLSEAEVESFTDFATAAVGFDFLVPFWEGVELLPAGDTASCVPFRFFFCIFCASGAGELLGGVYEAVVEIAGLATTVVSREGEPVVAIFFLPRLFLFLFFLPFFSFISL